jgi:hypothetical protein
MRNGRRGVKEIWKRIEEDSETQQARHSAEGQSEGCIVVQLQHAFGFNCLIPLVVACRKGVDALCLVIFTGPVK